MYWVWNIVWNTVFITPWLGVINRVSNLGWVSHRTLVLMQGEALAKAMLDDETMIQATPGLPNRNTRDVERICKPFPRILLEKFFLWSEAPMETVLIFLSCELILLLSVFMWAGQSKGTCRTSEKKWIISSQMVLQVPLLWMTRNDSENVICFGLSRFLGWSKASIYVRGAGAGGHNFFYPVRGLDQGNQKNHCYQSFFFFSSSFPVHHIIIPVVFLFLIWRHLRTMASIFAAVSYQEEDILFLACWGAGNGQI